MLEFMRAGGVAMWLILLFGGTTLGVAIAYLVRPSEQRQAFFRALSSASILCTLSGLFAGLGAVMAKVPGNPDWAHDPDMHLIVMTGLGEAMANPILGFSLLAIAWFVFAFGTRRRPLA